MSPEPSEALASVPDFSGKLVAFYVGDPSQALSGGILLEFPEFNVLGGRLFVVGRCPQIQGLEWASQLPSAVAWDAVIHYLVFASRQDYLQRGKQSPGSLLPRFFHRLTRS